MFGKSVSYLVLCVILLGLVSCGGTGGVAEASPLNGSGFLYPVAKDELLSGICITEMIYLEKGRAKFVTCEGATAVYSGNYYFVGEME